MLTNSLNPRKKDKRLCSRRRLLFASSTFLVCLLKSFGFNWNDFLINDITFSFCFYILLSICDSQTINGKARTKMMASPPATMIASCQEMYIIEPRQMIMEIADLFLVGWIDSRSITIAWMLFSICFWFHYLISNTSSILLPSFFSFCSLIFLIYET